MFSIALHRVYLAVLGLITMVLGYHCLIRVYTEPAQAINYGLYALGMGALFAFMLHRWFQLENLWFRAQMLLVPYSAQEEYRKGVRKNLNHVLSQKVFRLEMRRQLNKQGVFKQFVDKGTPVMLLDIAFPDIWNNHNYLRCAIGWIGASMPPSVTCQVLERKDTRLVFRFVHRDARRKDAQGLRDAVLEWKKSMQSVLVMRLEKCSVQDLNYVPQKLTRNTKAIALPSVPKTAFEEDVLLGQEHLRLHIGFNGNTYYTYFEDGVTTQIHGRREYSSWQDLWTVWQHMDEVQDAFKHPVAPKSSGVPRTAGV